MPVRPVPARPPLLLLALWSATGCALQHDRGDGQDARPPTDTRDAGPDAQDALDAPDAPDVPDVPDAPDVPDVPDAPDTCAQQPEICNGLDDNCDGVADNGPGLQCVLGSPPTPCTTACGTTGARSCSSTCMLSACAPPAESCNLVDDDCDGTCDRGVAGCRVPIYRFQNAATGDWIYSARADEYTRNPGYAPSPAAPQFYLYAGAVGGLVPLYRCPYVFAAQGGGTQTNHYLVTNAASCAAGTEEMLGYASPSAVCESVPLYRVGFSRTTVNFYTTSTAERETQMAQGADVNEVTATAWTTP